MLDPHPLNELGKHLLDPATERRLIETGIVFASRMIIDGQTFTVTSKTHIAEMQDIISRLGNNTLVIRRKQLTNAN